MQTLPTREMLMLPVLNALKELGGSGSIDEIHDKVVSDLKIPDALVNLAHTDGRADARTRLEYELGWVRTMLKGNGYVENSRRGIWALKNTISVELRPDSQTRTTQTAQTGRKTGRLICCGY